MRTGYAKKFPRMEVTLTNFSSCSNYIDMYTNTSYGFVSIIPLPLRVHIIFVFCVGSKDGKHIEDISNYRVEHICVCIGILVVLTSVVC